MVPVRKMAWLGKGLIPKHEGLSSAQESTWQKAITDSCEASSDRHMCVLCEGTHMNRLKMEKRILKEDVSAKSKLEPVSLLFLLKSHCRVCQMPRNKRGIKEFICIHS